MRALISIPFKGGSPFRAGCGAPAGARPDAGSRPAETGGGCRAPSAAPFVSPSTAGRAARLALAVAPLLVSVACGPARAEGASEDLAPARLLAPVDAAPAPRLAPLAALEAGRRALVTGEGVEVVHFFATWCAPCKRELPALGRFAARHASVPVVLVDVAEPEDRVRRFFATEPPPGPVLLDADRAAARAFGVSLLPATFVLAGGRIRLALEGEVAWDDPANDALVTGLDTVAGAAPPSPATR